jgi:hypothetical protein
MFRGRSPLVHTFATVPLSSLLVNKKEGRAVYKSTTLAIIEHKSSLIVVVVVVVVILVVSFVQCGEEGGLSRRRCRRWGRKEEGEGYVDRYDDCLHPAMRNIDATVLLNVEVKISWQEKMKLAPSDQMPERTCRRRLSKITKSRTDG